MLNLDDGLWGRNGGLGRQGGTRGEECEGSEEEGGPLSHRFEPPARLGTESLTLRTVVEGQTSRASLTKPEALRSAWA